MCQDIEDFSRGVALVFAVLYRNVPCKILLRIDGLDAGNDPLTEEHAMRLERCSEIHAAAMEFLNFGRQAVTLRSWRAAGIHYASPAHRPTSDNV